LTFLSDKLIALSGIAKALHESNPEMYDQYLAGIWKCQLPGALLWKPRSKIESLQNNKAEYRAPSWSWASVDGQISNKEVVLLTDPDYDIFVNFTTLESSYLDYVDGNSYGQVTAAHLYLRGPVLKARIDFSKLGVWNAAGITAVADPEADFQDLDKEIITKVEFDSAQILEGDRLPNDDGNDIFIIMLRAKYGTHINITKPSTAVVEGLLLHQIGKDEFHRVGWFRMMHNGPSRANALDLARRVEYNKFIESIPKRIVRLK